MKKVILGGLILLVLFLISCAAPDEEVGREEELAGSEALVEGDEELGEDLPPGQCREGWKCISHAMKAFQLANCSFGERVDCQLGCEDDDCKTREACAVGFKCKNDYIKGYQLESCAWTSTTRCEFGCLDAECLSEPNVTESEPVETVAEEVEPRASVLIINAGEQQEVGGHNLSLYLIEEARTRLMIDEKRSDWLSEGEIFSAHGVTVVVVGILFQSYQGGMRAVEYTIE